MINSYTKKMLLVVCFLTSFVYAQTPEWQWVNSASAPTNATANHIMDMATDNVGNVYITGTFSTNTIIFGDIILNSSSGQVFIAKYNPDGVVLWAKNFAGFGFTESKVITTDMLGNIFVSGVYRGTSLDFGDIILTNPYPSLEKLFTVKIDSSGEVIWARQAQGSLGYNTINGIGTDASGNIIVAGTYYVNLQFDNSNFNTPANVENMFIIKYNSMGDVIWAISPESSTTNMITALDVDFEGNIYVSGNNSNTGPGANIIFGNITFPNTAAGFVMKLDTNGSGQWLKLFHGGSAKIKDIEVDKLIGNVAITGSITASPAIFDTVTLVPSSSGRDMFISVYDNSGNFLWAKSAGALGDDYGCKLASDTEGSFYVSGYLKNSALFDEFNIVNDSETLFRITYLTKYKSEGNVDWAKKIDGGSAGNFGDDYQALSIDNLNTIYVGGLCYNNSAFDDINVEQGGVFTGRLQNTMLNVENFTTNNSYLYPNPVKEILNITFPNGTNAELVIIYNNLGQIVLSQKAEGNKGVVDVSKLQAGYYFVVIFSNNGKIVQKVIKN